MILLCSHGSVQNLASAVTVEKPEAGLVALDSALQEQERIITMSYTLASEASLKSKLVAGGLFCFTLGTRANGLVGGRLISLRR